MSDGARTRDHRNHNPVLYQLSYTHHKTPHPTLSLRERKSSSDQRISIWSVHLILARLRGLEPLTRGLEGRCSIQLSYRRNNALRGLHLLPPLARAPRAEYVVGAGRFELPTSCSQGRRANQAALRPA